MNKDIANIQQLEQEFAYVDSLITAHTNAAIAKVNAQIEVRPIVQMSSAQNKGTEIVQICTNDLC